MIDVDGNLYALEKYLAEREEHEDRDEMLQAAIDDAKEAEAFTEELEKQNAILSNNLANAEHAYNKRGERIDDLISQLSVAKIWLENAREQLYMGKKADRRNTADKIYSILQSFKGRKS